MLPTATKLIVFTDLDGCLLNKHDYDWSAASATLETLRARRVPVIMNSSKTVPEMTELANELGLSGNTFISENGSVIYWGNEVLGLEHGRQAGEIEVIGTSRDRILKVLHDLKQRYRFRSFADLGLSGVVNETQLSDAKAQLALARQGTEPLLWEDTEEHRLEFAQALHGNQLSLTKGGRFWHVAGQTNKGKAMQIVAVRLSHADDKTILAAIGDSPIDQSMLDVADVPIGIPTTAGLGVSVDPQRGIVAAELGAAGWASAITQLLLRIDTAAADELNPPLD